MIAFIDDHCGAYGVEPICKVLPIAPSTYHDHVAKRIDPGKISARARRGARPHSKNRATNVDKNRMDRILRSKTRDDAAIIRVQALQNQGDRR